MTVKNATATKRRAVTAATPPAPPAEPSDVPVDAPSDPGQEPAQSPNGTAAMVALFPDTDVAAQLAQDGGQDPETLHVTLQYLGDDSSGLDRAAVEAAVGNVASVYGPVSGELNGLCVFNPTGRDEGQGLPLVATLDAPGLSSLREAIANEVREAVEIPPDNHGFCPHMTLAYLPTDGTTPAMTPPPATPITFSDLVVAWPDTQTRIPLAGDFDAAGSGIEGAIEAMPDEATAPDEPEEIPTPDDVTVPAMGLATDLPLGATGGSVTDKPWDGSAGRFTDEQYQMAAAACDPASKGSVKSRCFLPHHEPGGAINRNGVHAAAQRVDSLSGRSPDAVATAKGHLRSHYTKDLKEDPPDALSLSLTPDQAQAAHSLGGPGAMAVADIPAEPSATQPVAVPNLVDAVDPTDAPYTFDPANCLIAYGDFANDDSGRQLKAMLDDGAPLWPSPVPADVTSIIEVDGDGRDSEILTDALAIEVTLLLTPAQQGTRAASLPDALADPIAPATAQDLQDAVDDLMGPEQATVGKFIVLWHIEGKWTDDGRLSEPGTWRWREPPVPLTWNPTSDGHDHAMLGGYITSFQRGASVQELALLGLGPDGMALPAVDLTLEAPDMLVSEPEPAPVLASGILACASGNGAPVHPPAWMFEKPDLPGPTPLQVTAAGHIYGHLAGPGCHVGMTGRCVTPQAISRDFTEFHHAGGANDTEGGIVLEDGSRLRVGVLTLAGGHAPLGASAEETRHHYLANHAYGGPGSTDGDTNSVVGYLRAYWDKKVDLPVVAGAVLPRVSEESMQLLRACSVSVDAGRPGVVYRSEDGKAVLVGLAVVPQPGFPFRSKTLVASGGWQAEIVDNVAGIEEAAEKATEPHVPDAWERLGLTVVASAAERVASASLSDANRRVALAVLPDAARRVEG